MNYSDFLYMRPELSLIAVTIVLLLFDLFTVSRHENYGSEQHFPELDP